MTDPSNYLIEYNDYQSEKDSLDENLDYNDFLPINPKSYDDYEQVIDISILKTGETNINFNQQKFDNKTIISEDKSQNLFQISKKKRFKPENIRIKVKVHYHKFIYSFFKDLIKSKFPKKKCVIRKIPHSITKIVSQEGNRNLMNMTLEEFLSQDVSTTFKCDSNQNSKNIEKLKKLLYDYEEKKFLSMTYKDFYEQYYLSYGNINFNFPLSSSTQFFCDYVKTLNKNERVIIDFIARKHFIQYFLGGSNNYSFKGNNELNVNNKNCKTLKFNIVKLIDQKK